MLMGAPFICLLFDRMYGALELVVCGVGLHVLV